MAPQTTAAPLTQLSEEEAMFRDAVRDFAHNEVRPRVTAMERAAALDPALLPKLFELGLMGIEVPERYGGAGGGMFLTTLAVEELSAVDASTAICVDVQNTLVIEPLLHWGNDAQRDRYLPRLASDLVGAYALSEANSGSDAFALETRASKRGDEWVLQGRKLWITHGAEAGLYLIFANVDLKAGYKGITAFLVERGAPGFSVGKKEDKLGIRASSTTELILDECRVPPESVLGEVGQGYKVAIQTLNTGRIGIGAQMIGVARGALDIAVRYVKERKQFGKAVAEFQGVQFQLAQAATDLEAARLMVYNAARLRDANAEYTANAAMAKLFSSQVAERVTSLCVELLGGYGYTTEYPVEKFWRDAKIGAIYEGTSNMQLNTISKLLLRGSA
jgi:alkylation response protein AidB-like acyl-CoA dehydrogenase